MSSRSRPSVRLWIAGLLAVSLVVGMAVAGLAVTSNSKIFTFSVSPTSVAGGTTGQVFAVTVTNTTPPPSNMTSLSVSVPSQFTVTGATLGTSSNPNASAVVSFNGQTVAATSLDPIKKGQYVTVDITTNVTSSGLTCGSGNSSATWSVTPWTGSQLTGNSYSDTSTGSDLTSHTTTITRSCTLSFTTQPSNVVVSTNMSPVRVSAPGATDGTTVTLSIATPNPTTATISGNTATTSSGVAAFSSLQIDTVGTYTLQASATNYTSATSSSFEVRSLSFSGQPSDVLVNTAISPAVTVTLSPTPASPVNVTMSKASGPGTLSGTLTKATASGVATFSDLKLSAAGTYRLQAAATGYGTVTSSSFEARSLSFTVQPSDAVVNTDISPAVTVTLSPTPSSAVNVTLSKAGGPGTLSGTLTAPTNGSGVATFSDLQLDAVSDPSHPYTLHAAATGYGTATSSPFQVYGASLGGDNCTAQTSGGDTSVTVTAPQVDGSCQSLLYTLTASTHEVDFFKNATADSKFQMTVSWGTPYVSGYPDTGTTTFDLDGNSATTNDAFTPDYCAIVNNQAQYPVNPDGNGAFWPNGTAEKPWCVASSNVAPHHFSEPSPDGTDGMQLTETFLGSGDPAAFH